LIGVHKPSGLFNYVTLLQWKLSNNEVYSLNITLFGCLQKLVASNQCTK